VFTHKVLEDLLQPQFFLRQLLHLLDVFRLLVRSHFQHGNVRILLAYGSENRLLPSSNRNSANEPVSESLLNGTSAQDKPFSALHVQLSTLAKKNTKAATRNQTN